MSFEEPSFGEEQAAFGDNVQYHCNEVEDFTPPTIESLNAVRILSCM